MLVDTHCHLNLLNLNSYQNDLQHLITQANALGVKHIVCVGIDLENAQTVIDIAQRFENVYATVGLHPSEVLPQEPSIENLKQLAQQSKVIGIGETGLDYHYEGRDLDIMRSRFRTHIRAAVELQKPLIIHSRFAPEDTIHIMREEAADKVGGIMHCFTESWEMAETALELGFYISFSGIITFKNAHAVAEVARKVPLDRILIETDAPYLTPEPFRGKAENGPQYVRFVAEKIADLKQLSFEEIARQTTANFFRLFGPQLKKIEL